MSDLNNTPQNQSKTSRVFDIIIARAIIDSDFRNLLLSNREEAIKEYTLSDADLEAISHLNRETLDAAKETAAIVGMVCSVGGSANS